MFHFKRSCATLESISSSSWKSYPRVRSNTQPSEYTAEPAESVSAAPDPVFRRDIVGLRAIAVVLVTLFHYRVSGFTGGFLGVDIFFVISGFLVTQILDRTIQKRRFSLAAFYGSRLARIYPPMTGMLVGMFAFGFVFVEPMALKAFCEATVAALLGGANHYFGRTTDYFDRSNETNFLLHLWSLSVELHFYALYPLLYTLVRRLSRTMRRVSVGCFALSSLLLFFYCNAYRIDGSFYWLSPRWWEFLAGVLAARYVRYPRAAKSAVSYGGMLMLATAILLAGHFPLWRSVPAVIVVCGTGLLLANPLDSLLLDNRAGRLLGAVSYSFYLWHWPVIVGARTFGVEFSALNVTLLLSGTLLLAIGSRRMLENPFGALRSAERVRLLRMCFYTLLAFAICGVSENGWLYRWPAIFWDPSLGGTPKSFRQGTCFLGQPTGGHEYPEMCFHPPGPAGSPRVLLFGDSHAAHLWPAFADLAASSGIRSAQATAGACPPIFVAPPKMRPGGKQPLYAFDPRTAITFECHEIVKGALTEIQRDPPELIVLSARWSYYDSHGVNLDVELRRMVSALRSAGSSVVIVGPVPEWPPILPQRLMLVYLWNGFNVPEWLHNTTYDSIHTLDQRLATLSQETGAEYLSLLGLLCRGSECRTRLSFGGQDSLVAFDAAHLNPPASRWIGEHLLREPLSRLALEAGASRRH